MTDRREAYRALADVAKWLREEAEKEFLLRMETWHEPQNHEEYRALQEKMSTMDNLEKAYGYIMRAVAELKTYNEKKKREAGDV